MRFEYVIKEALAWERAPDFRFVPAPKMDNTDCSRTYLEKIHLFRYITGRNHKAAFAFKTFHAIVDAFIELVLLPILSYLVQVGSNPNFFEITNNNQFACIDVTPTRTRSQRDASQ